MPICAQRITRRGEEGGEEGREARKIGKRRLANYGNEQLVTDGAVCHDFIAIGVCRDCNEKVLLRFGMTKSP